jgi:hypothetical protein
MNEVSAAYVASAATQLGSISAFLGGFAATFLAALLIVRHRSRAAGATIGLSATASVGFIVCVVGSTALSAGLHPDAPSGPGTRDYLGDVQVVMTLGFMLGVVALLSALGVSGWLRSRPMGGTTTLLSAAGLAAVLFLTVRVG